MLEFTEGPFTRPLAIIYKRGRELSPAVRKFIEALTTSKVQIPGGQSAARTPERAERSERPDRVERAERAEKV